MAPDQYTTAFTRAGRTMSKLATTFLQHAGNTHHLRVKLGTEVPASNVSLDYGLEGAWGDAKTIGLTPLNGEHKEANRDVATLVADSLTKVER